MEKQTLAFITSHELTQPGQTVAIALSGGADSVCLFHVLRALQQELHIQIEAVHVNHGIREEAAHDEAFVRELCAQYDVLLHVVHVDVPAEAAKAKSGIEETARRLRYEAFENLSCDRIALAHHRKDQAETVLLHLIRGAGMAGLTGMNPLSGRYIRPLLAADPEEIRRWLIDHHYTWVEDATNADTRYRRNYIRHELLPQIAENVNPKAEEAIAQTAAILQEDEAYLQALAEALYRQEFTVASLKKAPKPLRMRMLRLFLAEEGHLQDVGFTHLKTLEDLVDGPSGRSVSLPGVTVVKEYDHLILQPKGAAEPAETGDFVLPDIPWHGRIDRFHLELSASFVENVKIEPFSQNLFTKTFDYDTINESITVRSRRPGDYLTIGSGHKKLQDYMTDEKIPRHLRDRIPLIADGSHILWVVGHRMSDACKVTDQTKRRLNITIKGEHAPSCRLRTYSNLGAC